MPSATVHISASDLRLTGSYESTGDVLYLSTPEDDKAAPAQETPEGHAVRLAGDGQITHLTAINARWLLERDGELVASLRDGRTLRLRRDDLAGLLA
jgi:beta-galactosidase beta subunit